MNFKYYDDDYYPTNRDKSRYPKRGLNWCICDRNVVGDWEKCSICKRRNGRRRLKP